MLKNYFKIAIAVLKRRKFFTFISLFGISFTLTILIVLTAFVDNIVSANYPESNRDMSLYISTLQQRDSEEFRAAYRPRQLLFFEPLCKYAEDTGKSGYFFFFSPTNSYVNNKKLVINLKYTNSDFWDVMNFEFLEGKPYSLQQISNAEKVAVISEDTRKNYFGDVPSVVGKFIEADNVQYRVAGVVKSVPVIMPLSYADLYVPYTVSKTNYNHQELMGSFSAVLLANSKSDLEKIKTEYAGVAAKIKPDAGFDKLITTASPYLESFLSSTPLGDPETGKVGKLTLILSIFVLLFMLLPTLNLININISRIMERSSEIGVRKAFGASGMTLVGQFIVENIILTFLGALIGIVLSLIILQILNSSDLIANMHLTINLRVLMYSLIACLVFGLLSGVYPAWRMSRLQVVTALKAQ